MAEGGIYENPAYDPDDPEVPGNDDDDDEYEQDHDETHPFIPGSASTPGPGGEEMPMQTRHHEQSGLPEVSCTEAYFGGDTQSKDDGSLQKNFFQTLAQSVLMCFTTQKASCKLEYPALARKHIT